MIRILAIILAGGWLIATCLPSDAASGSGKTYPVKTKAGLIKKK